jgi:hypothetical protein
MTDRSYLKCEVCGAITIMRLQVGWLDDHPLRIPCGRCKILITGTVHINQKRPGLRYEIQNASQIDEIDPEFYIEASGELLTQKLSRLPGGPFAWSPPPFFQSLWAMGNSQYLEFKRQTLQFLHFCKNEWPTVRRVNELWLSGQNQYLAAQVGKYLPRSQFPMDSEVEFLRGVHQVNLLFLWPVLSQPRFGRTTRFLFRTIPTLIKRDQRRASELLEFFQRDRLIESFEKRLFQRIEHFVRVFQYLIPVFALSFYKNRPRNLLKEKGTTTSSVDDVKHFYSEAFEDLSEVALLSIAYNNLHHRGAFDKMLAKRKDVHSITDLQSKSKGDRLQFVSGSEAFDFLSKGLDNKLRNAIAHGSYTYNTVTQQLQYYPNGVQGKGPAKKIYLVNLIQSCWEVLGSIVDHAELIYQTRKFYFVLLRGQKTVHPSVFRSSPKVRRKRTR